MRGNGGRFGRADGGAIAMMVAVFAGAGVLLGVIGIGVEIGRQYVAKEQVTRGARATVYGLVEHCYNATSTCSGATATINAASLYALAQNNATSSQGQFSTIALCLAMGDGSAQACTGAGLTASAAANLVASTCPAVPFALSSTTSYVRLVTQSQTSYQPLLGLGGSKTFTGCGQAKWQVGVWEQTANPFVVPVCAWDGGASSVVIGENSSEGSGGGSRGITPCTVTWGGGVTPPTSTFNYASPMMLGLDPTSFTPAPACSDTVTIQLNSSRVTGTTIGGSKGTCPTAASVTNNWPIGSSRYVALSGDFVTPGSCSTKPADPTYCWNIKIAAFAKFQLLGVSVSGSSTPWAGGATPPSTTPGYGNCSSSSNVACIYGKWVAGSLEVASFGTTQGIVMLS